MTQIDPTSKRLDLIVNNGDKILTEILLLCDNIEDLVLKRLDLPKKVYVTSSKRPNQEAVFQIFFHPGFMSKNMFQMHMGKELVHEFPHKLEYNHAPPRPFIHQSKKFLAIKNMRC